MHFLTNYGLFLLKTLTSVAAILLTVAGIFALSKSKEKEANKIKIKHINTKYTQVKNTLHEATLNKKQVKLLNKESKNTKKRTKLVRVSYIYEGIKANGAQLLS